jgi:hypothetical protein
LKGYASNLRTRANDLRESMQELTDVRQNILLEHAEAELMMKETVESWKRFSFLERCFYFFVYSVMQGFN